MSNTHQTDAGATEDSEKDSGMDADTRTQKDMDQEMDIQMVMDIPVTMAVEVGSTRMSIQKILQLGRGSVVELDRLAGEPMDIKVNGVLVAHGEVVVVNEDFGVRITDLVRPAEWIRKLT